MEAGARVVRAMEYLGASSTSDGSSNTSSNNISSNNSSISSNNNSSISSNNKIGSSSSGNGSPCSSSSSGSGFVACTSLGRRRHGKGVAGGDCEGGEGRWSLPADVLDNIFSLLPVQDVIRAGAVCKWWQSVVSSYEARNGSGSRTMSSAAVEGDIYFPVFFSDAHNQSCFGFGIDSKKWRELPPITFLPALDDPDSSSSASQLVCSDKGLLCIEKGGQYYVCNPATKAYKLLPPMICCSDRHRHQAVDVHLQVERDGEAYTLVALCGRVIAGPRAPAWWFPPLAPLVRQAPGRRRLQQQQHPQQHGRAQLHQHALAWARLPGARVSCYDSRTNSWTPSPSRPAPMGGLVVAGSVWFRGVVYMLVQGDAAANVSLMAYHVERQTWARIGSVHPFEQESKARLVVVGDHVMAVTLDSKGFLVSSFKPPSDMDDAAAAAAAQGQGQGYEIQFHELFLEEGSEFLRDCTVEGWACVGYQTSIYIVTLRSLKLAVCHVFKKTWLRLQSGSQQCAIRTHLATPLSCPIEVGLRTPV